MIHSQEIKGVFQMDQSSTSNMKESAKVTETEHSDEKKNMFEGNRKWESVSKEKRKIEGGRNCLR